MSETIAIKAGSADRLAVSRLSSALTTWFLEQALPAWWDQGTDLVNGGFYEQRDWSGAAVEAPRRTRVVARQIYVFSVGLKLGWRGPALAAVEHGLKFLLHRLQLPAGHFAAAVMADGDVVKGEFDLYEQAFALFAMASAQAAGAQGFDLPARALQLLACLQQGYKHPWLGFEEANPPTLPLKSNPHMHLLEAMLAWAELPAAAGHEPWASLANEIVELCMTQFIDPSSGALREYFASDWSAIPGDSGQLVESGHQFEWAWLLMRWSRRTGRQDCLAAALRLIAIGEQQGVDANRAVAVNALYADFSVADAGAKLWPQTERVKAWCARVELAQTAAERSAALAKLAAALDSLLKYLRPEPYGMWHEAMAEDGTFPLGPCRASSFYHLACAIETLHELQTGCLQQQDADEVMK